MSGACEHIRTKSIIVGEKQEKSRFRDKQAKQPRRLEVDVNISVHEREKDKRKVQEDGKSSNNDDDENVEISSIGLLCNLCDFVWLRAAGNLR